MFATEPVTFYQRNGNPVRQPDGQYKFVWSVIVMPGCLWVIDNPETEEEAQRYSSTDRMTLHIPKGNEGIDFTGYMVAFGNAVYKVEGNSVTYMPLNTPGPFNRTVYAYRRPEDRLPTLPAEEVPNV